MSLHVKCDYRKTSDRGPGPAQMTGTRYRHGGNHVNAYCGNASMITVRPLDIASLTRSSATGQKQHVDVTQYTATLVFSRLAN